MLGNNLGTNLVTILGTILGTIFFLQNQAPGYQKSAFSWPIPITIWWLTSYPTNHMPAMLSEANWKPLHSPFTKPWLSESHNFYYSTFQDPGWYFFTYFIKYVSWAWTSTWYDLVRWFLFLVHIRGSAPPCLQSHITSRISPIVVHYPDWRLMQGSVDRIKSINNNSRHSIRRWYIRIMRQ